MASNIVSDGLNIHKSARNCSRQKPIFHVIIISNTRDSVSSGYPNTENRVENTTRSGVFLTKFVVFG